MTTIAFDTVLMRPGCAVVQGALGATIPNSELQRFDSETWLTSPTKDMGVYEVTPEQLEILIVRVKGPS